LLGSINGKRGNYHFSVVIVVLFGPFPPDCGSLNAAVRLLNIIIVVFVVVVSVFGY
jgi:hypothetical protein